MTNRPEAEQAGFGRALAEGAVVISAGILGPIVMRGIARRAGGWVADRASDAVHTMSLEVNGELDEGPLHTAAGFAADVLERMRAQLEEREQLRR